MEVGGGKRSRREVVEMVEADGGVELLLRPRVGPLAGEAGGSRDHHYGSGACRAEHPRGPPPPAKGRPGLFGGMDAVPDALLEAGPRFGSDGPLLKRGVEPLELLVFSAARRAGIEVGRELAREALAELAGSEGAEAALDSFAIHGCHMKRIIPQKPSQKNSRPRKNKKEEAAGATSPLEKLVSLKRSG